MEIMSQKKSIINAIADDFKEAADKSSSSLLIEISQEHLESFNNLEAAKGQIKKAAETAFHQPGNIDDGSNILIIDEPDAERINLIEHLLSNLDRDIQKLLRKNVVSTLIKGIVTFSLKKFSGGLSSLIPGDLVIEEMIEAANTVKNSIGHLADSTHGILNPTDESIDYLANEADEKLNVNSKKSEKFYISAQAQNELEPLISDIQSPVQDEAKAMRIIMELLRVLAINSPKLILIYQPEKLNKASVGIISLLMAYEKAHKELSINTNRVMSRGMSICLVYTDKKYQLGSEIQKRDAADSSTLASLNDLHNFAQRYQLLETPDNNRPKQAISSKLFVGRNSEIDLLKTRSDNFNSNISQNTNSNNIPLHFADIVIGDAGMGKTSLIQQHTLKTFSAVKLNNPDRVVPHLFLSIFNPNVHSNRASGLAALRQSIEEQAKKLDKEINKSKSQKFKNEMKKRLTGKGLLGTICSYFSLPSEAVDIGISVNQYVNRDNKSEELNNLNNAGAGEAAQTPIKQQFENIDKAINKLAEIALELSGAEVALTVFIDDLHWLDEFTAQYLLSHLCQLNYRGASLKSTLLPVRFVISTRKSDLATRIQEDIEKAAVEGNIYFSLLINALKLDTTLTIQNKLTIIFDQFIDNNTENLDGISKRREVVSRLQSYKWQVNSVMIPLEGFNLPDVQNLIEKNIASTLLQRETLATALIEHIGNNKDINTMHLVESLNMLCDPLFYNQDKFTNSSVQPLIQYIGSTPKIIIDENEIEDCIKGIFNILAMTYKESFRGIDFKKGNISVSFNLSALAVLEERFQLIQRHVGSGYAEACKNTLLIANFLGETFDEALVKNCISSLIKADENKYPGLGSIESVFSLEKTSLNPSHYEVLDDIYNIISRMQVLYSELEYQMSHSLWNSFLFIHIENWLKAESKRCNVHIKNIIGSFSECLIDSCIEFFSHLKPQTLIEQNHVDGRLLNIKQSISHFAYCSNEDRWAYTYIVHLKTSSTHYLHQSNTKSIELLTKATDVINKEIKRSSSVTMKDDWSISLARTQVQLANAYQYFGQIEKKQHLRKVMEEKEQHLRKVIDEFVPPNNKDVYMEEIKEIQRKIDSGDTAELISDDGIFYLDVFNPLNMIATDMDLILAKKDYSNESHYQKVEEELKSISELNVIDVHIQEFYDYSTYLSESLLTKDEINKALNITLECHKHICRNLDNSLVFPRYIRCCQNLANIYFMDSDKKKLALTCTNEAIDFIVKNDLNHSVELITEIVDLYLLNAYYSVQFEEYDAAISNATLALSIINIAPSNIRFSKWDKYRALNTLASCYKAKGEYNQAITEYLSAMKYLNSLPVDALTSNPEKRLIILRGIYWSYLNTEQFELAFEYAQQYLDALKQTTSEYCGSQLNKFTTLCEALMAELFMEEKYQQCGSILEYLFYLYAHSFSHLTKEESITSLIDLHIILANHHDDQFQIVEHIEGKGNYNPELINRKKTYHLFVARNSASRASLYVLNSGHVVLNIAKYRNIQEFEMKMLKHSNGVAPAYDMKLRMYTDSDPDSLTNNDSAFIYANNCIVALSSGLSSSEEKKSIANEAVNIFGELCTLGYIDQDRYQEKCEEIQEAVEPEVFTDY